MSDLLPHVFSQLKLERRLQRAAFLAGAKYGYENVVAWHQGKVEAEAKVRFPIIGQEVNAVRDPQYLYEWGIVKGELSTRWIDATLATSVGNWYRRGDSTLEYLWVPTKDRVAVWTKVFDEPIKVVSE